jgi:two-component system, NarL family, response regulator LiaR
MAPAPTIARPRVLLVEDDRDVREALRELLEDTNIEVVGEAGDGSQGLEMARQWTPDVVLMDLRMPVMGGLETSRRLKEEMPLVQVVILTAYEDPALKEDATNAGVYAYLVKGCPPRMLGEVTIQAWEMKRALEAQEASGPNR